MPTGALVYAAAVLGVTLTFAAGAVLAAQIMPTRSAAVGVTVALLGVALLVRMLADGAPRLAWTAWTTPFGLTARAAPYADNRVGPLLVLAAFPIAFGVAAIARRGIGTSERVHPACNEPSAPHRTAGLDRRVRGSPRDPAHHRLGDGHRRVLPSCRRADRIDPGVLRHQSPVRRAGRGRRVRRSRFGERLRRRAVQPACDTDRPVRGNAAGRTGRRRERPPLDTGVRHRRFHESTWRAPRSP